MLTKHVQTEMRFISFIEFEVQMKKIGAHLSVNILSITCLGWVSGMLLLKNAAGPI